MKLLFRLFRRSVIALFAAWATAGSAAESSSSRPEAAMTWPDDAALEAQGARIGAVAIIVRPIFDPDSPDERKFLFRLADRLHVDTRKSVIEAQLLFRSGDAFSRRVLDETERNLRELRFINEPEIVIVGYRDGLVDLAVIAHDVWTTNPGISFGRAGGKNSTGLQLEELSLLGLGKKLAFEYEDNVDRSSYRIEWHDPNVGGSRWLDTVELTDSDDGESQILVLERPFYSLDSRWSTGLTFDHDDSIQGVYRLGHRVSEYGRDARVVDVRYGRSQGLRNHWAHRWIAGLRHDETRFSQAPDDPGSAVPPDDRRLNYPYLRIESIQDDFETTQNLDQISRTEDLDFGARYAIEIGWSATAFGADRNAAILQAQASRGFRLGDGQSLFLASELKGRIDDGSATDVLFSTSLRYYRQTSPRSTFFAFFSGDQGHELDPDHELMLGGDNGLRGYPLRYQTGSGRALLTVEQRFYTHYSLWKLANIGGAIFIDAGETWGESAFGPTQGLGVLKDVGFGLRLGNTRTGLANVVHLDIAFPLDGDPSINKVQFLVKTKASF